MKGLVKNFTWSDKPQVNKEAVLATSVIIALIITGFKLRPYFSNSVKVVSLSTHTQEQRIDPKIETFLASETLSTNHFPKANSPQHFSSVKPTRGSSVIERPLFDGLSVILYGKLLSDISSYHLDSTVEVKVESFVPDSQADVDSSRVLGAKLIGTLSGNPGQKRINIVFKELVLPDGNSYLVSGAALDPSTKTSGVKAEYASGLSSRLFGVLLDRAITTVDQFGMTKILENVSDNSVTERELKRVAIDTNQQAAMSLSAEATKPLRETQPELNIQAGTPLLVRIRVLGGPS